MLVDNLHQNPSKRSNPGEKRAPSCFSNNILARRARFLELGGRGATNYPAMSIYTEPPELRAFRLDKPTLLVCWWATSFCTLMILLRITGRFIRTERLFIEDKVAAVALIPLNFRMACVHYVLKYGTNNADFSGIELTPTELRHKALASGLVLLSRFCYAAT
ncbi:hypothetical protein E4U43_004557, partial [Claviceps pusilla]